MTLTDTEKVAKCVEDLVPTLADYWGSQFIPSVKVEYADINPTIPTTVLRLRTDESMKNNLGGMHGGSITTFFDESTGVALFAVPKIWEPAGRPISEVRKAGWNMFGTSRSLSLTFLRPVQIGKEVLLTCKVQALSRRYGYITLELTDAETGKKLAVGSHDIAMAAEPLRTKATDELKSRQQSGGKAKL